MQIWSPTRRDGTTPSSNALVELEAGLAAFRQAAEVGRAGEFEHLRAPLRALCAVARHEGVPPEQFIAGLRMEVNALPTLQSLPLRPQDYCRREILTLAIVEYFKAPLPEEQTPTNFPET